MGNNAKSISQMSNSSSSKTLELKVHYHLNPNFYVCFVYKTTGKTSLKMNIL